LLARPLCFASSLLPLDPNDTASPQPPSPRAYHFRSSADLLPLLLRSLFSVRFGLTRETRTRYNWLSAIDNVNLDGVDLNYTYVHSGHPSEPILSTSTIILTPRSYSDVDGAPRRMHTVRRSSPRGTATNSITPPHTTTQRDNVAWYSRSAPTLLVRRRPIMEVRQMTWRRVKRAAGKPYVLLSVGRLDQQVAAGIRETIGILEARTSYRGSSTYFTSCICRFFGHFAYWPGHPTRFVHEAVSVAAVEVVGVGLHTSRGAHTRRPPSKLNQTDIQPLGQLASFVVK
jgi:hypothetical protein